MVNYNPHGYFYPPSIPVYPHSLVSILDDPVHPVVVHELEGRYVGRPQIEVDLVFLGDTF